MSGKNVNNNKDGKQPVSRRGMMLAVVVGALVLFCLVAVSILVMDRAPAPTETPTGTPTDAPTQQTDTPKAELDEIKEAGINLGHGMLITDIGKYTGIYMEDGSDELVSGILMIVVTNTGEDAVQYAEIELAGKSGTAEFSLSTLAPGASVVLLEQNRMAYDPAEDYASAVTKNVVLFQEPLSLCEDQVKLQVLDGAINVTNISGTDITGDIVIYYKNSAVDMLYGGITYRVRIEGGLKSGEIRQIMASHFSESGSAIMFVTVG